MRDALSPALAFVGSLVLAASSFAAAPVCPPQTEIDVTSIRPQIVLVGEVHGTNEIPRFIAGLVCSLSMAGQPVILGLEHAGEEQEEFNRYVASAGGPTDRAALLRGINWSKYSDGRGSAAMFELVETMRRLRAEGRQVAVLAINKNENLDVPRTGAPLGHVAPADNALLNRMGNVAMAHNVLAAAILNDDCRIIVLSGYSHTSTAPYVSQEPMFLDYAPMGQMLNDLRPTFTIGIETGGGERAGLRRGGGSAVYRVDAGPLYVDGTHVDAKVRIETLTASPLARDAVK